MRKFLILLLSVIMSVSVLGLIACGETETPGGNGGEQNPPEYTVEGTPGLRYNVYGQGDNKYAAFIGLSRDCKETNIVIASHYQGVKVTEIGDGVNYMASFDDVETLKVHRYIKVINASSLNRSKSLKTIDFEDECQLEKIGGSAFKNAKKLENFNYKGKINFLGDGAFAGCESLKTTAYEGAEYIGSNINPYLILLNGSEAESVKVHKDCEAIHSSAFEENATTKTIIFESNDTLLSIGGLAFSKSAITEITIPKTVTNIGESAFAEANSLVIVTFDKESELTTLAGKVFRRCQKLEEVRNFECTKITEIGEELFYFGDNKTYPSSLKYIKIPKTVTLIKKACMWGCNNVTEIVFPKDINLVEIEYHAFRGCTKVQTLIIPKSVEKIGYDIIAWGSTKLKIFCEAESQKLGWNNGRWNQYKSGNTGVLHATYYYSDTYKAGAWHYVEGEPELW